MIKLFLWNFRSFMGFFRIFLTLVFLSQNRTCQALAVDRAGRPDPESVDRTGRPMCTKRARLVCHLGRSTERSTDCKHPTLGLGRSTDRSTVGKGGRPSDRPAREHLLSGLGRSTDQSTAASNGQKFDRWRSTGRSTASRQSCQNSSNG